MFPLAEIITFLLVSELVEIRWQNLLRVSIRIGSVNEAHGFLWFMTHRGVYAFASYQSVPLLDLTDTDQVRYFFNCEIE